MKLSNVITAPVITEKTMAQSEVGEFTFSVDLNASKGAIAQEVKRLFDADAVSVRTMIMPGKKKRVGRSFRYTKTPKWKKAVVILKDGQSIDLFKQSK